MKRVFQCLRATHVSPKLAGCQDSIGLEMTSCRSERNLPGVCLRYGGEGMKQLFRRTVMRIIRRRRPEEPAGSGKGPEVSMRDAGAGRTRLSRVHTGVNRATVLFLCWLAFVPLCSARQEPGAEAARTQRLSELAKVWCLIKYTSVSGISVRY